MSGPTPPASPPQTTAETADRVRRRTYRERRYRVWRNIFLVIVTTAFIIILFAANRDEATIRTCRHRMEVAREALQARYDAGLPPAPRLPLPDTSDPQIKRLGVNALRHHAYYNALHDHLSPGKTVIGVCCCRWPHSRLIGASGRNVIVLDTERGQYEVRWIDEDEFARLAPDLRLVVPGQLAADQR